MRNGGGRGTHRGFGVTAGRFDGASAWGRLGADEQAAIGAAALEMVVGWHDEQLAAGLREASPYETASVVGMSRLEEIVVGLLAGRVGLIRRNELPAVPVSVERICRVCGCTDLTSGGRGRGWVEGQELCLGCAAAAERAAACLAHGTGARPLVPCAVGVMGGEKGDDSC